MKIIVTLITFLLALPVSWYVVGYFAPSSRARRSAVKAAATFVPEAEAGTVPRPGSRRWARALYHNQMITMEELDSFYYSHPEDLTDADR